MAAYRVRLVEFEDLLNSEVINLKKLRETCFTGIPDEPGIRSICWKLLLDYLPVVRTTWPGFLSEKRALYSQFIQDFIVKPGTKRAKGDRTNGESGGDHPLNPNPDSSWQVYFQENEVLMQIDKDVRRLCPDISFFQSATNFPCVAIISAGPGRVDTLRKRVENTMLKVANVTKSRSGKTEQITIKKRANTEYAPMPEGAEAHWEVVERILFLYAKLNPGQGYVQGMNEIIGPIYYTFASDPDPEWQENAEADTFFCFTNLMSEVRDNFIKSLDDSSSGIYSQMKRLTDRLKRLDIEVFLRLEQQELRPQFYSFRWLTLLLSQEFPLPDVLRIWDSLFADGERFNFLIEVCLAMVLHLRNEILQHDFSHNMKLLQNFPLTDIHVVLAKAVEVSKKT